MNNNKIVAGILAHVDAGKTTLSESLLLETGVIRKAGRVDNGDAFLDTDSVERARGITIYSKNARIPLNGGELILIDTPGHVDFSTEMERALSVMDFAILLISGPAGIQSHTKTLWSLLKSYNIPTVVFVNKMDMEGANKEDILSALTEKLSNRMIAFSDSDEAYESIASQSEKLMDEFLENGTLTRSAISTAFKNREFFPVFFGSALRHTGIDELLTGLSFISSSFNRESLNSAFSGKVYKISHDDAKRRLTFLKVTGGTLKVKALLGEEKINELRIYSGEKYETVPEVFSGEICCIPGLLNTHVGDIFGEEKKSSPFLSPAISYAVHYPREIDQNKMLSIMKELEDEDPSLGVIFSEQTKEIYVSLMGDVQTEVLKHTLSSRYGINACFGEGKILYKETIDSSEIGVGHFEPLRHYAEVHLLLEPLERGSGLEFDTIASEDLLDKNWQRLVLTHLKEREHRGVLTGSPITDMKLTLVAGRAHIKHTEGGDFRQATYRAIRQGLMKLMTENHTRLLEPYYDYTLKLPETYVGRAMTDITAMPGTCNISENDFDNHITILTGKAPVSAMNTYSKEIATYTRGQGELSFLLSGYDLCHNEEEVLSKTRYNPDNDLRNPSGSVFCSHGAGTVIPWYEVDDYKHIEFNGESFGIQSEMESLLESSAANKARRRYENSDIAISTEEIDQILKQSSYANENGRKGSYKGISQALKNRQKPKTENKEPVYTGTTHKDKYLLVDGYNVIHAWEELSMIASSSLVGAVGKLNDILCNYQAITGVKLIVVYDAYKVKGHQTEENDYHNITVVYTRESQTADQYIERYANENAKKYDITVVTSDGLEQIIIRGEGCHLISSREFELHNKQICKDFYEKYGVK